MRLGATIGDYLGSEDPDDYIIECQKQGYRAACCPELEADDFDRARDIKSKFASAHIIIAEVPAWFNALHPDNITRQSNISQIAKQLALSEELEAACCGTIVGSFDDRDNWDSHVGPHPENFTDDAFDAIVDWVRRVLDDVKPTRTKLTLEMSPWTLLDGPEIYLDLIKAVDRDGLAVHLDPANAVRDPRTFYSTGTMIDQCFDILGPWIRSCHAKDVDFALDARTVGIKEVIPGRGVMDYKTYIRRINKLSNDMPLIIEHLANQFEFLEARGFILGIAEKIGSTV